jgi:hypothetical protein
MTRQILWFSTALMIMAALISGCKSNDTVTASAGEGILTGTVYSGTSAVPLSNVSITVLTSGAGAQTAVTGADGKFSLTFTVDSTLDLSVRFSKGGFSDTTTHVVLRSGAVAYLDIRMSPIYGIVPGGGSGIAQTIAFLGAEPTEISVYGVGGKETSLLRWEVRDSLGLPIDAAHAVNISFTAPSGPGGGEYVSPPIIGTSDAGQAVTTLNAGTRSGVVQIRASATAAGRTIVSSPVQVIIRGGFPVQQRFSIASPFFNFPALGYVGKTHEVSVLAGDIYSNPVALGTAVYFRSSAGVIQPSVFTNGDGQGTVQLISGNPMPVGSASSGVDGYHYVVARTLGQGGTVIQDSIQFLWSGRGTISNVNPPGTFSIPNAGQLSFTFELSDQLGHPLAQGTTISVVATIPPPSTPGVQQNQAFVVFGNNGTLSLGDVTTAGPGRTQFSFILKDGTYAITEPTPVNLTITAQGPNIEGTITYTLAGTVN